MAMQAAPSRLLNSLAKSDPEIMGHEYVHHLACCSWTALNSSVRRSLKLQACLSARTSKENFRPLANFRPAIWKDTFTSIHSPNSGIEISSDNKQVEEFKDKVKEMLIASTKTPVENVTLIDSLCRLGTSYHFEIEIEEQLNRIFESHADLPDDHDYDLHTTALLFRVLRQHGFKMSCDVFTKFKDNNGMFKETLINDVRGLLTLYEATHLRMHREDILEEALAFTAAHLKSLAIKSSPHLAKHIADALEQPLHKGVPRLEAYKYISFYEQEECRNEILLMFAKLDFNRVQLLHQQELNHLTSWWKDLKFKLKLSYARDRIVEIYFWAVAEYFEPCYSHARLMNTKILVLLTLIDDTFDAYGTFEELQKFTDAVQRWDNNAAIQLPTYMQILYTALLNLFDKLEDELSKQGRSWRVSYVKDTVKEMVRAYLVEAKWFHEGFVPEFDEHMSIALITAGCFALPASSFLGMGEIADIEAFEWLQSNPKIARAAFLSGRLMADIVAHEFEQKRGHVASSMECYMKQYGLSRMDAMEELKRMSTNAWKDLNEDCMRATVMPMQLLTRVLSFARIG
ncbi:Terpene synthase [Melia azedarach]|uniref:Terpene synthase n=1 Tax=Melia azedarach TaxID=155640 RepID=A0ACC1YL34_MELAZ|nr:Terpene synthase [Melia azedarach]